MPRPRLAPDERRDFRLPAPVLTGEELAFVESQAAVAGLSLAEYVRRRVLGRKVAPARALVNAQLLVEINRIGVNLNQIARSLNSDRPERADLAEALRELRLALAQVAAHGS